MGDTLALLKMAHEGDKHARDTLIEENIGLVWSIVRRFQNRGVEMEDLFQIGSIGLIKAVDKFNTEYEVQFSTYAVPMIAGEIKRFLRDDGILKVSRSLKENAGKAYHIREKMEKEKGREPTMEEIARELEMPVEELVLALEAGTQVESLQQVIYQGEGGDISLMDKLEEKENVNERVVDKLFLEEMLGTLEGKDRELIFKRYFQEKTQTEIAREMGISQVQVSRLEKRILKNMRNIVTVENVFGQQRNCNHSAVFFCVFGTYYLQRKGVKHMTQRKKWMWISAVIFAGALVLSLICYSQREEKEPGGTLVRAEVEMDE